MTKTINGKEFYLLSHNDCETAYFVRHLDNDELGLKWEVKRIRDGEVLEMAEEFFFSASDVLEHVAEMNGEDVEDLTLYAEINDDGIINAKDVEIDYVVMAHDWVDDEGWDYDEYVMYDENITTYRPEDTVDDADLDDFSWMEEGKNLLFAYKERGMDAKIYAVLKIFGTDVIVKKGDKVLASEDERLSMLMEEGYGEDNRLQEGGYEEDW